MRRKKKFMKVISKVNLIAPRIIDLDENYEDLIDFIASVRGSIDKYKKIIVDFQEIESISPGGALLVAAELDRWRRLKDTHLYPYLYQKWNPEVRRLFRELGLFRLLRVPYSSASPPVSPAKRFVKFISGCGSEGRLADQLSVSLQPVIGFKYTSQPWYNALTEAMTNVSQHAYPEDYDPGVLYLKNRWWMSGHFDTERSLLTVLFCDQGAGIPLTLPRFKLWETLQEFLNSLNLPNFSDSVLIQAAFEIRRTRTGKSYRGRGLGQLMDFLESLDNGQLKVVSGKGEYKVTRKHGSNSEELFEHDRDIGGTFIEWTIPIVHGGVCEGD